MRELFRGLATAEKTVFVSSDILGEVRLMVDVVGIIAAGRLVREGPIEDLLAAEAMMRVRVSPEQTAEAARALASLGDAGTVSEHPDEPGWLTVRVHPQRGAEVARSLAGVGIYPMALESGSEL